MDLADSTILFFDVETTGLSRVSDRIVQLAWVLADKLGNTFVRENHVVRPEGYVIPSRATSIHGIDTKTALKVGQPASQVLQKFASHARKAHIIVGHNISFDLGILRADLRRQAVSLSLSEKRQICTMRASTRWCRITKTNGSPGFKFPRLDELHFRLFGEDFENAHDAMADVEATMRCFYELVRIREIVLPVWRNPSPSQTAEPTPTASPSSSKYRPSAPDLPARRTDFALTRQYQGHCSRCGTMVDVTLNHGERQVACPNCYAINTV
jgi:DNA polymerase III epsilon subunit-like protein